MNFKEINFCSICRSIRFIVCSSEYASSILTNQLSTLHDSLFFIVFICVCAIAGEQTHSIIFEKGIRWPFSLVYNLLLNVSVDYSHSPFQGLVRASKFEPKFWCGINSSSMRILNSFSRRVLVWWTGRDLNPRPSGFLAFACKPDVLWPPYGVYQAELPAHNSSLTPLPCRLIFLNLCWY